MIEWMSDLVAVTKSKLIEEVKCSTTLYWTGDPGLKDANGAPIARRIMGAAQTFYGPGGDYYNASQWGCQ